MDQTEGRELIDSFRALGDMPERLAASMERALTGLKELTQQALPATTQAMPSIAPGPAAAPAEKGEHPGGESQTANLLGRGWQSPPAAWMAGGPAWPAIKPPELLPMPPSAAPQAKAAPTGPTVPASFAAAPASAQPPPLPPQKAWPEIEWPEAIAGTKAADRVAANLREQIATFHLTTQQKEIWKLSRGGASPEQLGEVEKQQGKLAEMKKPPNPWAALFSNFLPKPPEMSAPQIQKQALRFGEKEDSRKGATLSSPDAATFPSAKTWPGASTPSLSTPAGMGAPGSNTGMLASGSVDKEFVDLLKGLKDAIDGLTEAVEKMDGTGKGDGQRPGLQEGGGFIPAGNPFASQSPSQAFPRAATGVQGPWNATVARALGT